MIDFKVLIKIKKNALKSIKTDSEGHLIDGKSSKFLLVLFFRIIPFITALTPWFLHVKLSDLSGYVTTGIAIFTGLFFSLLLNISAKIRIEKENKNIDIANFQAFKENMRQISNITQYIIILGILVMLLVLFNSLLNFGCNKIEYGFTSIALFLLIRYFVCLFFLLQRFFYVLRDEINNIL